jgi:hypothetical protein
MYDVNYNIFTLLKFNQFISVRLEVEDRKNFLNEMISLGRGREYKNVITTEISQVNIKHYFKMNFQK